jgi:uncharacterized membrane protein YeaQ/YmgE (transglycosylase-associated protein family)
MDWLQHLLIGALMGLTVSLISSAVSTSRMFSSALIGALAASLAGAIWMPVCERLTLGFQTQSLAGLWSMGVAMLAVIGNNELRHWR